MSRLSTLPVRTARWSATHPWRAIGCWLLFVTLAVGLATAIPTAETTDEDYRVGESGRAEALVHDGGLDGPDSESIVIDAPEGSLDQAAAEDAGAQLARRMAALDAVDSVAEPAWSPDGSMLLVEVLLASDTDDVAALQQVTADVADAHPDLRVTQAGGVSLDAAINDRVAEDLGRAEVFTVPVTLGLMLLAFGALIAAGIPVLLAATSVAATIGISAPLSHLVHAEPTVASMIVLIGMAVGVDYTLFYLKREREERARGRSTLDAVEIAAATSGHAILVSGGAVVASLAGLYVVGSATFNSLATGAIVVVAVAVLGSITVLPALLVKLGRWVDRPRVPLLWRLNARIGQGGLSRRILAPVVRRPVLALGASALVVGLLAAPALGLKIHSANLDTLPEDIAEVATLHRISDAFPAQGTTATVVVRTDEGASDAAVTALGALDRAARGTGEFTDTGVAPVTVSDDGRTAVLTLAMPYDEADPAVDDAVRLLRSDLAPAALDGVGGEYAVGGDAAESLDFADRQSSRTPVVIGLVLLLTMLVMVAAFRSLPVALASTALNLLSVGVAFGVLRIVFQEGHFSGLLGFTSPGFVIDWIPLFVLVVLVGLSMDYHVFVLSRVRELAQQGLPAREAVRRGISESAGVITSAAAVMVSVFAIFATLSLLEMKMMGVGLAVAILVDATLIRLVMLPALLVLLGDRAWWAGGRRPDGTDAGDRGSDRTAPTELAGADR